MEAAPRPSTGGTSAEKPAKSERSLTPAGERRAVAKLAARPRSKAVLVAIVVLLVLAITALLVKQKLGPHPSPGTALRPIPALAAPGPTK